MRNRAAGAIGTSVMVGWTRAEGMAGSMESVLNEVAVASINARLARRPWWPVVCGVVLFGTVIDLGLNRPSDGVAFAGVGCALAVLAWIADQARRTTRLTYDLRRQGQYYPYAAAMAACGKLTGARRVWHVVGRDGAKGRGASQAPGHGRDGGAGTGGGPRRERVRVAQVKPPFIRTSAAVWGLFCKGFGLYFLPDMVLLYHAGRYTALPYASIRVTTAPTTVVERDRPAPSDGLEIASTWQHVDREGRRDQRARSNRRLPVMRYQELRFMSSAGVAVTFLVSSMRAAERSHAIFGRLTQPPPRTRAYANDDAPPPRGSGQSRRAGSGQGRGQEHDRKQTRETHGQGARGQSQSSGGSTGSGYSRVRFQPLDARARAYATLGLASGASPEEVKKAFYALAQQYHPDKIPPHLGPEIRDTAERKMKEIAAAYTLLSR